MRNGKEIILFVLNKTGLKNIPELKTAMGKPNETGLRKLEKTKAGAGLFKTYVELAEFCKISVSELIDDLPNKIVAAEPSEYKTTDPYEVWMAHLLVRWRDASDDLRESIAGGLKSTFGEPKCIEILNWLGKSEMGGGREKDGRKRSCR
jgi:hypothetical protein